MQKPTVEDTGPPISLERFRALFAWAHAGDEKPPSLEYLWPIDVAVRAEDVWQEVSDTSTMNHAVGFPEMQFREEGGVVYGSIARPVPQRWIELPWNWNYPYFFSCERRYGEGPASRYLGIFYLDEFAHLGLSRIYIYTAWWLQNDRLKSRFARSFEKYREGYERFARSMEERNRARTGLEDAAPAGTDSSVADAVAELRAAGAPADAARRLASHIFGAPETALVRIRPRELSGRMRMDLHDAVTACLAATRAGYLVLSYDLICPHCRQPKNQAQSIAELPELGRCEICGVDFDRAGENALEVTFHPHPSHRRVERHLFCSAEPATKPHIRLQQTVLPGETRLLQSFLRTGQYRMRTLGRNERATLEVSAEAQAHSLVLAPGQLTDGTCSLMPAVQLENPTNDVWTCVIEDPRWDEVALRPGDLWTLQSFRDHFGSPLPSDTSISMGTQTILFTDMVGSTRLYEEAGDGAAFQAVRRHFARIYAVARDHHGSVVKTIGDAALLAFSEGTDGLSAALALQEMFRTDTEVQVRVAVHRGPCLAVNLGSGIDFFGRTVNTAAKLQQAAGAGEIVATASSCQAAGSIWPQVQQKAEAILFEHPALREPLPVFRLRTEADRASHSLPIGAAVGGKS